MITVNSIEEAEGKWVTEGVRLLTAPKIKDGRCTALANVEGQLCIVELRVKAVPA